MTFDKRLSVSLFLLRLGVFVVMLMWTIDKFVNPTHTARVFEHYYKMGGLSNTIAYAIGAVQLAFLLAFLGGVKKRWTYGLVLLLHTVSTLSSWKMYLDPWGPKNLLFFAAWPMLAAIVALYLLRDRDNLFTVS